LRRGLLAIGALAGVAGLAGVAEKARSGQLLSAKPAGVETLKLYGSNWHLAAQGLRRGDLPKRGDQVSISGVLSNAPGEAEIGTFFASVVHLDSAGGHGSYSSAQLETHSFQLPGGTLIGMGTATGSGENAFAIVGGTGRYLGALGSYVTKQSPLETGGDGTAEFTLTIKLGR
jgi:hypothetical protein